MHIYTFKAFDVFSLIKFVIDTIKDIPSIHGKVLNTGSKISHQDRHEDVPQKWRWANEMLKYGNREKLNLWKYNTSDTQLSYKFTQTDM